MTVFVGHGGSPGQTAAWLLASADENDIDRRSIKTTRGGFNIPDELAAAIGLVLEDRPAPVVAAQPVPEIVVTEEKTPPPGWDDPLPEPDVAFGPDGKVYLKSATLEREIAEAINEELVEQPAEAQEVDREVIRAWAKDNGLQVAEKGALKKSVLDAFYAAQIKE
jgi:hypothetical protein